MRRSSLLAPVALIAIAAPVALVATGARGADESERCIPLTRIDYTEVIDDRTIAFFMKGGAVYLNRLAQACPNLGRERRFSYRTSTSQLCAIDGVTVLEDYGLGFRRGATCTLREFLPSDEDTVEMLLGEQEPADITIEEVEVDP